MTRESLVSPAQLRGLPQDTIIQEAVLSSQLAIGFLDRCVLDDFKIDEPELPR